MASTEDTKIPEYKSECGVNASQMRALNDKPILILKVYKPYRHGWDDNIKKFRSFYNFPSRLSEEVIYSWDESAKIKEGDTFSLREKFWDGDMKKFGFRKIKFDGAMYKAFKKVFDVDIAPWADANFKVYDSQLKQEVEATFGLGNTFTLKAVSASRVIGMIEALELDSDVVLVDGKDKTGNPAKVRPYDFEDAIVPKLAGKFLKPKVRGEGMDTRYTFKEVPAFSIEEDSNKNPFEPISVEDIPFR